MRRAAMQTTRNEGVWLLASFIISVGGFIALSEYAKWRDPSGSKFPLGLPIGAVAAAVSLTLVIAAIRSKPRAMVIFAGLLPGLLAIWSLWFVISVLVFRLLGVSP